VIDRLAIGLHELGAIQFGNFTLKSGMISPVYLDLRLLVSDPALLELVAETYARLIEPLAFDRIAAVPYAGLPIGTAVAIATGRPMIYPRKEAKAHGTGRAVEGHYRAGETALLLDDVISSGTSKLEAIHSLEAAGLVVRDIVVLVDRTAAGAADLGAAGYRVHAVMTMRTLVDRLRAAGRITETQAAAVHAYLGGTGPTQ
jgi:uridine monophosphate synthetase